MQACEAAARVASALPRNLSPVEAEGMMLRQSACRQAEAAGLPGIAATWGGDWRSPPEVPW